MVKRTNKKKTNRYSYNKNTRKRLSRRNSKRNLSRKRKKRKLSRKRNFKIKIGGASVSSIKKQIKSLRKTRDKFGDMGTEIASDIDERETQLLKEMKEMRTKNRTKRLEANAEEVGSYCIDDTDCKNPSERFCVNSTCARDSAKPQTGDLLSLSTGPTTTGLGDWVDLGRSSVEPAAAATRSAFSFINTEPAPAPAAPDTGVDLLSDFFKPAAAAAGDAGGAAGRLGAPHWHHQPQTPTEEEALMATAVAASLAEAEAAAAAAEPASEPAGADSDAGIYNVINAGNRCFSNSLFQCLVKCRSLMNIIEANRNYSGDDENVIRSLIQLLLAFSGDEEYGVNGTVIEGYYHSFIEAYKMDILDKNRARFGNDKGTLEWLEGKARFPPGHIFEGDIIPGAPPLIQWSLVRTQQDANEHLKNILDILEKIPEFKQNINININTSRTCSDCGYVRPPPPAATEGIWPEQLGKIEIKDGSKISDFFKNAFEPKNLGDVVGHCYGCGQSEGKVSICDGFMEENRLSGKKTRYRCSDVETQQGNERMLSIIDDPKSSEGKKKDAVAGIKAYTHVTPDKEYGVTEPKPGKCHKNWTEKYEIQDLPELLIIDDTLLKRFDVSSGVGTLNRFSLYIEQFLNIPNNRGGNIRYELSGICIHGGGESLNYGHYTALVKGKYGGYYHVNDVDCQGESCNDLGFHYFKYPNINEGFISTGAVLFFYEKMH